MKTEIFECDSLPELEPSPEWTAWLKSAEGHLESAGRRHGFTSRLTLIGEQRMAQLTYEDELGHQVMSITPSVLIVEWGNPNAMALAAMVVRVLELTK